MKHFIYKVNKKILIKKLIKELKLPSIIKHSLVGRIL